MTNTRIQKKDRMRQAMASRGLGKSIRTLQRRDECHASENVSEGGCYQKHKKNFMPRGIIRDVNPQEEVSDPRLTDGTDDRNAAFISNSFFEGRQHADADYGEDVSPFSNPSLQFQTHKELESGPIPTHHERKDVGQQCYNSKIEALQTAGSQGSYTRGFRKPYTRQPLEQDRPSSLRLDTLIDLHSKLTVEDVHEHEQQGTYRFQPSSSRHDTPINKTAQLGLQTTNPDQQSSSSLIVSKAANVRIISKPAGSLNRGIVTNEADSQQPKHRVVPQWNIHMPLRRQSAFYPSLPRWTDSRNSKSTMNVTTPILRNIKDLQGNANSSMRSADPRVPLRTPLSPWQQYTDHVGMKSVQASSLATLHKFIPNSEKVSTSGDHLRPDSSSATSPNAGLTSQLFLNFACQRKTSRPYKNVSFFQPSYSVTSTDAAMEALSSNIYLDTWGDLETIARDREKQPNSLVVSSSIMRLPSPVCRFMFDPQGYFREDKGPSKMTQFPNDDAYNLSTLLRAVHVRSPRSGLTFMKIPLLPASTAGKDGSCQGRASVTLHTSLPSGKPANDRDLTLQLAFLPASNGFTPTSFLLRFFDTFVEIDDNEPSSPATSSTTWPIKLSDIGLQAQTRTVKGVLFGWVDNDWSMLTRLESTWFIQADSRVVPACLHRDLRKWLIIKVSRQPGAPSRLLWSMRFIL